MPEFVDIEDYRRLLEGLDTAVLRAVAAPETVSFGNFLTHKRITHD
ncbi:MAG: hypothetical protein KJO85_01145 [Gammaproteobacteria bacterium]|nr:hypothetical protein [Gammaproteobacteria bacterium]